MRRRYPIASAVDAVALLAAAAAGGLVDRQPTDASAGAAPAGHRGASSGDSPRGETALAAAIGKAQRRLREVPGGHATWPELGSAYVQRARLTGDPTYYPRAEAALRRSLALNDTTNYAAMVGQGSLANARHDFAAARDWATRALTVNPYSATGYAVRADALTQLGDYPGATAAAQRALDLRPGVSTFTRASYDRRSTAAPPTPPSRCSGPSTTPTDRPTSRSAATTSASSRSTAAASTRPARTTRPASRSTRTPRHCWRDAPRSPRPADRPSWRCARTRSWSTGCRSRSTSSRTAIT